MYEDQFPLRLAQLRTRKGSSARDMSLSIGQNAGYINNIETGKALPSMLSFFYICEYLEIEPKEFFDFEQDDPKGGRELSERLGRLEPVYLEALSTIAKGLAGKK